MESKIVIEEGKVIQDYFPSLFVNKDKSIVILATARTGEKTFEGVIIHSNNNNSKAILGMLSSTWTYEQFKRLPKGSKIMLEIIQEN